MKTANRLDLLPPYLFAELESKAASLRARGIDLVDLGIADPDLRPPAFLLEAVRKHLDDPDAHQYPTSRGDPDVRRAVARWFLGRFGVELDPAREIVITLGSKEGLADLARAVVDPGDRVGVPDPGYPVYAGAGAALNNALAVPVPLNADRDFLPDLQQIDNIRLLFLNYPNNPTGAVAPEAFYRETAQFAEEYPETLIAWDAAYCELSFAGFRPPSLLQFTRRAVELHSLSKMMNCTGYRIGFAVGDPEVLDALVRVKTQVDSGAPVFIQRAMAESLERYNGVNPPIEAAQSHSEYGRRKAMLENGLAEIEGVKQVYASPATFFVWAEVDNDTAFVDMALEKGVILTPGRGFGQQGKGFVRATVTRPGEQIEEALQRLRR